MVKIDWKTCETIDNACSVGRICKDKFGYAVFDHTDGNGWPGKDINIKRHIDFSKALDDSYARRSHRLQVCEGKLSSIGRWSKMINDSATEKVR